MNDTRDNELVIRLQTDDIEAFNTLYWRHHEALYYNILKLIKDADASMDILQEVFITLWEKRLTLDPNSPVSNWLFTISYNKSIDYLKKVLKQSVIGYKQGEGTDAAEEQGINLKETQFALLEKAVHQLSPQKRKVFELCKLQGKSYEETAKELGISKHTVKEYLSDAILSIKEYIKQHPDYLIILVVSKLLTFVCQP